MPVEPLEARGFTGAFQPARLIRAGPPTPSMSELLEIRLLGPFEVLAGGTPADVGGSASSAAGDACAPERPRGRRRRARRRPVGRGAPGAPRNALHHHIARLRAALGERSIVGSADGYALKTRASTLCGSRSCSRRRARRCATATPLPRDAVASALALWRGPALQGLDGRGVVQRRGTPARDAARRRARGGLRGQARARRASRAHAGAPFGARGQPLPRAALGAADAGALPQRPPGRRARDVPGGPARARRRAGLEPGPELRRLQEAIPRTTPRSPPSPSTAGAAGNLPRLRRRSSDARTSSPRSRAFCTSTAS